MRNVIPSYCEAVITVTNHEPDKINNFINNYAKDLMQEFADTDPNLKLTIQETTPATQIIAEHNALHFINALASVFNGVWRMNNKLGIAETSSNIGVVSTTDTHLKVITLQRSAIHAPKNKSS